MSSIFHLEHSLPTFQSLIFFASSIAALLLLAALYAARSNAPPSIPLYVPETAAAGNQKKRWMYDSVNLLQEAYKKFNGKPFKVWTTEGNQIAIPPDYVDELKMLPDHTFPSALRDFFLHSYLWPIEPSKLDYGHVVMKNDLNKNMGAVFPEVRDEVRIVFPLEFPDCNDWLAIQVYPKVLRLVSRVNGKIFVGSGLHQNEEWVKISCNYTRKPDKNDPHFHGISQLGIGAASVNTTSQLITNAIFNLATYPEYFPILKDEMDSGGHLTATFQRKALRPITLSDGTHIPPGTFTFSPANAIGSDPNIYPDANTFDGLRFYNLRQASLGDEKKYQLTSITKTQMQFGSGRHACPGRWFASHQIKLVLAAVIDRYELRLKDGEGRPKSIVFQTNQLPDPKAEILFKNRKRGVNGGAD
ncbi:MAG: hypothetical protein ASARMPREDX12_002450 [Alectoria sarmentosa]|nr:MAG: hypothetical protein ASARMPREDX12_002450 [Alectoria sarmentosa]CAD6593499.1 MAG: hypothetical protein ASARMPRED_007578 [Alectoria sarmentosa]